MDHHIQKIFPLNACQIHSSDDWMLRISLYEQSYVALPTWLVSELGKK